MHHWYCAHMMCSGVRSLYVDVHQVSKGFWGHFSNVPPKHVAIPCVEKQPDQNVVTRVHLSCRWRPWSECLLKPTEHGAWFIGHPQHIKVHTVPVQVQWIIFHRSAVVKTSTFVTRQYQHQQQHDEQERQCGVCLQIPEVSGWQDRREAASVISSPAQPLQ